MSETILILKLTQEYEASFTIGIYTTIEALILALKEYLKENEKPEQQYFTIEYWVNNSNESYSYTGFSRVEIEVKYEFIFKFLPKT